LFNFKRQRFQASFKIFGEFKATFPLNQTNPHQSTLTWNTACLSSTHCTRTSGCLIIARIRVLAHQQGQEAIIPMVVNLGIPAETMAPTLSITLNFQNPAAVNLANALQ